MKLLVKRIWGRIGKNQSQQLILLTWIYITSVALHSENIIRLIIDKEREHKRNQGYHGFYHYHYYYYSTHPLFFSPLSSTLHPTAVCLVRVTSRFFFHALRFCLHLQTCSPQLPPTLIITKISDVKLRIQAF